MVSEFFNKMKKKILASLNPYCSGIWSRSRRNKKSDAQRLKEVLILIVVEYGLGVRDYIDVPKIYMHVLILIVVEYGLGVADRANADIITEGLNPYCSGIWSRRELLKCMSNGASLVLILIVVEYGLGVVLQRILKDSFRIVLILIVVEYGLGVFNCLTKIFINYVLILIVVEYGLGDGELISRRKAEAYVLILIVVEYGLGV